MALNLNIAHGTSASTTSIADIGMGQEIQLHTSNTIPNDNIYLTLSGVTYYNGGIRPAYVEIPYTSDYDYTGSEIIPTWTNYDADLMTMSGDISGTNAGTYTTIFALKDGDSQWSDGTSAPKYISWHINYLILQIPSADKVKYTGSTVEPDWQNYNPLLTQIGGTTSAIEVGTYTATFTLLNLNYKWTDGTQNVQSVEWVITNKWYEVVYMEPLDHTWEYTTEVENPNPELYDGVYQSNNPFEAVRGGVAQYWKVKIIFNGYTNFKVYLRSYSGPNDRALAGWLDQTKDPNPLSNYGIGKNSQGTTIDDYTEVTYSDADTSKSHYFIISYRRPATGSVSGTDKGYLLIARDQDA